MLEQFHTEKQGSSWVDDYFTRLKIIWDEMCILRPIPVCSCDPKPNYKCGGFKTLRKIIEAENIMKFVKGLKDSFENIRSQVLLMSPLPDINVAFNMAITHECQQNCSHVPESHVIYANISSY